MVKRMHYHFARTGFGAEELVGVASFFEEEVSSPRDVLVQFRSHVL